MIKNINIDHKIIAKHFKTSDENMRVAKRKFFAKKDTDVKFGLWETYIKAYNFDTGVTNDG